MSKPTLVVGDLHGKFEVAEAVINNKHNYNVVFVGDFLDDFKRSIPDQVKTLTTVLEACEKEPGRVKSCMGNHELSYLEDNMRWSGLKVATYAHVSPLAPKMYAHLKPYLWVEGYLVSHAGVSQEYLKCYRKTLEQYLEEGKFFQIGAARGGFSRAGGLYWCDWWKEFTPVPGVKQIVGHSAYRPNWMSAGVVTKGEPECLSYNIDCLNTSKEILFLTPGCEREVEFINWDEL